MAVPRDIAQRDRPYLHGELPRQQDRFGESARDQTPIQDHPFTAAIGENQIDQAIGIHIARRKLDRLPGARQFDIIAKMACTVVKKVAVCLAPLDEDEILIAVAIKVGGGNAAGLGDRAKLARLVKMGGAIIEEEENRQKVSRDGRVEIAIPIKISQRRLIAGGPVRACIPRRAEEPHPVIQENLILLDPVTTIDGEPVEIPIAIKITEINRGCEAGLFAEEIIGMEPERVLRCGKTRHTESHR
nr:hypothetical protein [Maricaulis sp.]